jgi:hypothetical protein
MATLRTGPRSFRARIAGVESKRVYIPLPFDPGDAWGTRDKHHVAGTINDCRIRGVLEKSAQGYFLALGPSYRRGAGFKVGDEVSVTLAAEGPQSKSLAPDIAAALAADPEAANFFDSLAQWYRKGYLTWIDATKRSPDVRKQRIAEMIVLLKDRQKERPR